MLSGRSIFFGVLGLLDASVTPATPTEGRRRLQSVLPSGVVWQTAPSRLFPSGNSTTTGSLRSQLSGLNSAAASPSGLIELNAAAMDFLVARFHVFHAVVDIP